MVFAFDKVYSYRGKQVKYKGENIFKTFEYLDGSGYFCLEPNQEFLVEEYKEPVAAKTTAKAKTVSE